MARSVKFPLRARCMDCNKLYEVGDKFPRTKLQVEGMTHLTDKEREDIFKYLAVNIASFCDYVYLQYELDPQRVEIDVELQRLTHEKACQA